MKTKLTPVALLAATLTTAAPAIAADSCRPHAETHSAASLPKISRIGDFDPSGVHMSEVDLPERIERYGGVVNISRIALLRDDCDGLPSFDGALVAVAAMLERMSLLNPVTISTLPFRHIEDGLRFDRHGL
jgi:hypothetical protein